MQKLLWFVIALILIAGGYWAWISVDRGEAPLPEPEQGTSRVVSAPELGLRFSYSDDYTLVEREPGAEDDAALQHIYMLMRSDEYEDLLRSTEPREGPPAISLYVFTSEEAMPPRQWAEAHQQYSNINLVMGEVRDAAVGGADGIRYRADGLYVSDTLVLANGGFVYIVAGQYIEEDSKIRRDFETFVGSIEFTTAGR